MAMDIKLEDTLNRAWKDDKTGFGYRMLQKMGWKEDKGLGKDETGMSSALKIKKREDGLGLGVVKDHAGNSGWGTTVSSFNAVLDLLNSSYSNTSKKKSKKSKKAPTIQVRIKYGKISAAKDIRNKSATDMQAILGHHIPIPALDCHSNDDVDDEAVTMSPRKKVKKEKKAKRSTEMEGDGASNEKKAEKKKKKRKEGRGGKTDDNVEVIGSEPEVAPKKKRKRTAE